MALFVDGLISSIFDLQNYESAVLTVANSAGIDLAGKMTLAQEAITNQILLFLLRKWPYPEAQWTQRRVRGVSDVVVTGPLRQWHAHKSLALVYRDVYDNQLNDRYLGKWKEYEELAQMSSDTYFQAGVGIVADPLPKPSSPQLASVAGDGSATSYYALATWINGAGQESSPSDIGQMSTSDGEQLTVAVVNPPITACGWNAYVGETPETIRLQNEDPIAITSSWTLTGPLALGRQAGRGQQPTWFLVDYRVIERG